MRGATNADEALLATLKRVRAARDRFVDEPIELLPKIIGAGLTEGMRVTNAAIR